MLILVVRLVTFERLIRTFPYPHTDPLILRSRSERARGFRYEALA